MGGPKTYVPYASFYKSSPQPSSTGYLSAAGKCRIYPETCLLSSSSSSKDQEKEDVNGEFQSILNKAIEQSQVGQNGEETTDNKQLKKKYMKQGIAMAQSYLTETLNLDTSVIEVEVVLNPKHVLESDGCIVSCFLDAGCQKVVLMNDDDDDDGDVEAKNEMMLQALDASRVPKERLSVHINGGNYDNNDTEHQKGDLSSYLSNVVQYASTISVYCGNVETDSLSNLQSEFTHYTNALSSLSPSPTSPTTTTTSTTTTDPNLRLILEVTSPPPPQSPSCTSSPSPLTSLTQHTAHLASTTTPQIPSGIILCLRDSSPTVLGQTYASSIRTDRPDGLFATVVCSRSGEALGLVYSSVMSIIAALECGRGVYYSRSRGGLWRKGDTSGMYQVLHRIDVDCDGDALRFVVTQLGGGCGGGAFCHLGTYTCWGEGCGVRHLEDTLQRRLVDAPTGSYTKRLFDDEELLRDKLVEEAQELSEAESKKHVAEELADVLYFAMVKAAKAGVSIDDAVSELDRRTKKVTRRKGDSKAFRIAAGDAILNKKS